MCTNDSASGFINDNVEWQTLLNSLPKTDAHLPGDLSQPQDLPFDEKCAQVFISNIRFQIHC